MSPNYNSNSTIQHYRRNSIVHTPLLLPLFLPASRSTLFVRDPHFPLGMPFKLLGYIYTIPTIYMFLCGIYIIRTSTVIRSDDIYIFFYAVISTSSERHGMAIFGEARASQGQGPSAIFVFCFCVSFLFHGRL